MVNNKHELKKKKKLEYYPWTIIIFNYSQSCGIYSNAQNTPQEQLHLILIREDKDTLQLINDVNLLFKALHNPVIQE
jgi:hypothetical protein